MSWVVGKLSCHAVTQSQTRETRHTIPTGYMQASYPSMQLANQKPGKLDMLSQHAVEANHSPGKENTLSQHTQHRHTIPACIVKINVYKSGCKISEHTDTALSCTARRTRTRGEKSKQPQQPWENRQEV